MAVVVSSISSRALSCHGGQVKVVAPGGPSPLPYSTVKMRGMRCLYGGRRGVVPIAADASGLRTVTTVKEMMLWQNTRHVASSLTRSDHEQLTAPLLLLRAHGDGCRKRSGSALRWSAVAPVKAKKADTSSDGKGEEISGSNRDRSARTSTVDYAVIAGGLISLPVVAWSLFTLKATGCGLPPGPGGSLGALEGISYLVVVGIAGWSLLGKLKGTPTENGLVNVIATLSYLTLLAGAVVFALQLLDYGFIPPPLPGEQCFG
ncbi:hypothetical protein CBR_g37409 [Chara braunii]|uniref:Uncharacterized protein n=1 Tax=Chara braunii TaxID=69332 RepID=A0A388LMZ2_CHABU|nr:hypothetical protein CBR_g37409 [Chara braunii]|eukprot:GBG83605.1 hypothetical protein CBR_g37409 [Chara braunii]